MLKSQKAINNVVEIVFAASCIITGVFSILTVNAVRGFGGIASLLFLPIFWLLRRFLHVENGYMLNIELLAFIILAFHFGVVLDWYNHLGFYDIFVHTLSGVMFTTVGLCGFWLIREDKRAVIQKDSLAAVCSAFCFSQCIAVLWETFEYVGFLITGHDSQNVATTGVSDTMEDLIACLIGSLLMATVAYGHLKGKWKSFLMIPPENLYQAFQEAEPPIPAESIPE